MDATSSATKEIEMIIFGLEGVLADCEHRMHFIDPKHDLNYRMCLEDVSGKHKRGIWYHDNGNEWQPAYKSFYEACGEDKPIESVLSMFTRYWIGERPTHVEIWSSNTQDQKEKIKEWLINKWFLGLYSHEKDVLYSLIKTFPLKDTRPAHVIKEEWLDQSFEDTKWGRRTSIDFVVESDPETIAMFRRRGIFVFDVNQKGE